MVYLVHNQHGVDGSFHTITRDGSARNEAEYSVASPHPDLHTCNGRCGGGERMRSLPLQILTSSFFVVKSINTFLRFRVQLSMDTVMSIK